MKILRKSKLIIAMILAVIITPGGVTTYADSFMPPEPFEIWSDDGTTVFRWNPGTEDNWAFGGTAQAGVYQNDELIYSVDNLPIIGESAHSFLFSTDFRYLVYRPSVSQIVALGFFDNGVLLRSYRIDELVRDMNVVTYSVSTAAWESRQGRDFDAANNTFTIVTRDNITYVFDITTGEIIHDTAGDTPFIPSAENSWGHIVEQENALPLWARMTQETPSPWAQESVERADELGLLPDSFRSGFGRNTTRPEFTTIAVALYEHLREPITGRHAFTDTNDTNVEKAAYLGIVSGVGDNRFDPNSPLTREQAAVMLSNLAEALGQPFPAWLLGIHPSVDPSISITDFKDMSSWAMWNVVQVYQAGIMSGIGGNRFAPHEPYTIEQSIVTIISVYDFVKSGSQANTDNQFPVHYIRTNWYEGATLFKSSINSSSGISRRFLSRCSLILIAPNKKDISMIYNKE